MKFVAAYFIVGIVVSVAVAFGRNRKKHEMSPLYFLVDGSALSFLFGFALWPLWIAVQLIERSFPSDVPRERSSTAPEIGAGALGTAVTDLKPGGRVRIDSAMIDAVSDFGIITAGERIEVLDLTPTGVRVRAIRVE